MKDKRKSKIILLAGLLLANIIALSV